MSDKKEFESAFPETGSFRHRGMSLRDYFAAKALGGMLADPEFVEGFDKAAEIAYQFADGMLAAREK